MRKTTAIILNLFFLFLLLYGCTPKSEQKVVSLDGVLISYQIRGNGEPALVFVHGWCCDKSYWSAQVEKFWKKYKVVTIDLAGHGESGLYRENWGIENFGEDVVAVINHLGLEKVILIGHSMGGAVNVAAAAKIPLKVIGLVGVDTYQDFVNRYSQEQLDQYIQPFKDDFVETTRNFVRSMFPPTADSALIEQIANDVSSAPQKVAIEAFEGYFKFNTVEALKNLKIPVFAINADKYPTNVESNQQYADFKVKIMPGLGHFVMMEDPPNFNKLLQEVIDEIVNDDSN